MNSAECLRCTACGCKQDRHFQRDSVHAGECTGPDDFTICPQQCPVFVSGLDEEWLAITEIGSLETPAVVISGECPRCGHGLVWHPPPARDDLADEASARDPAVPDLKGTMEIVPSTRGAYLSEVSGLNSIGCTGNCQICDAIEKVLAFDASSLRR